MSRSKVLITLLLSLGTSITVGLERNIPPWFPLPDLPTAPPDFRFPVAFDDETHDNVASIAVAFRKFVIVMGVACGVAFLFVGYVLYELLRPRRKRKAVKGMA